MRPLTNSYGHHQMKTPNIDKLASEGVQFNQAYTNIAVCGASRASILTGVRGSQARFVSYYSRADEDLPKAVDLAEIFKNNGYKTFSIGKKMSRSLSSAILLASMPAWPQTSPSSRIHCMLPRTRPGQNFS